MQDPVIDRDFVVTGPTGWIGQALLHWLHARAGDALAERVRLFGSRAQEISVGGMPLVVRPIAEIAPADTRDALVFHLAYLTRDKLSVVADADYAQRNLAIDDLVLAALKDGRPAGAFVASSGAASEVACGRTRDLYGMLKLHQEARFTAAALSQDFPIFTARIFNIAGPHVNKTDLYALASFITQALATGRIGIRADKPVYRSYTHIFDLLAVACADMIAGGTTTDPIEIAGAEMVEMGDVALAVARELALPEDVIDRPSIDFTQPSVYAGDPCAFHMMAMRHGIRPTSFARQVADTARFLRRQVEGN